MTMPVRSHGTLARLVHHEAAPGVLLVLAALLAMFCANTPLADYYHLLLNTPASVTVGGVGITKPLLLWINDGLMAVFFFAVGLELKREFLHGDLRDRRAVLLPGMAALGGMFMPAVIYVLINAGDATALRGWAIPAATDIAFAVGVLALLGKRVPHSLRIFLLSLAILDDLGAVIIIALFYTADLSTLSLAIAGICLVLLAALNYAGTRRVGLYLLVGAIMWVSVLKSGVHATLAGVALALFIPHVPDPLHAAVSEKRRRAARHGEEETHHERRQVLTVARRLEMTLHPWVAFLIMPVFAFANAGVDLRGLTAADLLAPVPLGIALGLFLGKQYGVFLMAWLTIRLGGATLPAGATWRQLYGVSVLCGIGFTMSLFIASLAFESAGGTYAATDRLGILAGTMLSALLGYVLLRRGQAVR